MGPCMERCQVLQEDGTHPAEGWLPALAGDLTKQPGHCSTHLTITEHDSLPRRVYAHHLALSEAVPKGD